MADHIHNEIVREWRERQRSLLDAAAFVESIPEGRFNMDHWWLPDGMAFDDDRNKMYRVADGPCGCAIGNMIQAGLFGLTDETVIPSPVSHTLPSQGREEVFVRIGDTFGVNYNVAEFMFDQYAYPHLGKITREQVARRIRFVAQEYGVECAS